MEVPGIMHTILTAPGVFKDITDAEYHRLDSTSAHALMWAWYREEVRVINTTAKVRDEITWSLSYIKERYASR